MPLKEITNSDIENFITYLHTNILYRREKPLSYRVQKSILTSLKSIIRWCQLHRPDDVPQLEIFTGNEYPGVNHKLKIDFIPDEIVIKINEALKTETNPYIKYGIIILQSTGMRMGDLLRLRTDCVDPHLISGYTISWFDHKNRRKRAPMPVRVECVMAVERLVEATKDLRDTNENNRESLFVHNHVNVRVEGKIAIVTQRTMQNWLKQFTKRHNIMDANGEYYNLTSHQFRRTLGTDMLSSGTDINVIRQVLGHTSIATTKRFYADVNDSARAKIFNNSIGIIGNINQLDKTAFDNTKDYEWFKENKEKAACLSDGYCTKPIVGGKICDKLLNRQKCYSCSRYITTPEYLPAHKNHKMELEKMIAGLYGTHYAEHFLLTIMALTVIIERLEMLNHADN
jgi:integrase